MIRPSSALICALGVAVLGACVRTKQPISPSARFDLPGGVPRTSTAQVTSAVVATPSPSADGTSTRPPQDVAAAHEIGLPHDRGLEQEVGAYLGRNAVPAGSDIRVTALPSGLVVLSGTVPTAHAAHHALDAASRVPGVTGVIDDLHVAARPPAAVARGAALVENVASILAWDPRLDGGRVHVQANELGAVRLSGVVATASEARAAIDDAYAAGATRVQDDVDVIPHTVPVGAH